MNPKTKHLIVTGTGLLLLLSGFLFLPSPYTIIIALPVFLIGLLIIWSTKLKTKFKVLCTVLPIVLFVPYAQLVMYLYKNSMGPETKIDLIIDEEFHGKVVIVNNLDCPNTNEVGKRTKITVPKNGIAHYNGNPKISKMYTKVIEKTKTGKTRELNWFKLQAVMPSCWRGRFLSQKNPTNRMQVVVLEKEVPAALHRTRTWEEASFTPILPAVC